MNNHIAFLCGSVTSIIVFMTIVMLHTYPSRNTPYVPPHVEKYDMKQCLSLAQKAADGIKLSIDEADYFINCYGDVFYQQ